MQTDATVLSDGELVGELMSWAGRVAAGEVVLLRLIGELAERGLWASEGSKSCAHWLAWKLGLTPGSAYERIRVAKALRGLPLLAEAMATGRCSYVQARAITRVAAPSCEATWIELAQHTTAAQLEKAARAVRRALNPDQQPALKRASLTWDYAATDGYAGRSCSIPTTPPRSWPVWSRPPARSRPTARPDARTSKTPSGNSRSRKVLGRRRGSQCGGRRKPRILLRKNPGR